MSALRAQQQKDGINRKLLEQRKEVFQKQVYSLKMNEASLTRTNVEPVSISWTTIWPTWKQSTARAEKRQEKASIHRLKEELADSQLECERLQEQLQQVQLQLDTQVRKQSQHEAELFKARAEKDQNIQKLENDLRRRRNYCTR